MRRVCPNLSPNLSLRLYFLGLLCLGFSVGCTRQSPAVGRAAAAVTAVASDAVIGTPAATAGEVGYVDICVGARHSCAVNAAGKVFCWGSASEGELGVPGLPHSAVPTAVSIPEPIVQLRCNQSLTCARSRRGQVFCWGDDRAMSPLTQLTSRPPVAVAELAGSDDLWVLSSAVCGLSAGALRCDGWVPASLPSGLHPLHFVPTPQRAARVCLAVRDDAASQDVLCLDGRSVPRTGAPPRPPVAPKVKAEGTLPTASKSAPAIAAPPPVVTAPKPVLPRPASDRLLAAALWGGSPCRFYASGPVCDPLLIPGLKAALGGALPTRVLAVSEDVLCLGLGDGTARCTTWMGSPLGPVAPSLGPLRALALSETHACAILPNGQARCWGQASHGELGDGTVHTITRPQRVLSDVSELAVADDLSCARRWGGDVQCWGTIRHCDSDEHCQPTIAPSQQATPSSVSALALGSPLSTRRLCVLGPAGWACWFGDWQAVPRLPVPLLGVRGGLVGQDGRTWDWAPSNPPERPRPHFFQLAGQHISSLSPDGYCAIDHGTVKCGHCGVCSAREAREILTTIPLHEPIVAISSMFFDQGANGICAISATRKLYCIGLEQAPWRRAERLQPVLPEVVASLPEVQMLSLADGAGQGQGVVGCAVNPWGNVLCFGDNSAGQLGDGSLRSRRQPQPVVGLPDSIAVGVGRDHACALTKRGEVYCWGSARRGAVGIGLPVFRTVATTVAPAASQAAATTAP